MRLRYDDCEMEGRTHYAESSESDDDEAMSSDADPTETEVAETLDHERYAKGNEYYIFCDTQKGTSIMIRKGNEYYLFCENEIIYVRAYATYICMDVHSHVTVLLLTAIELRLKIHCYVPMDKLGKWWNVLKSIKLKAPKITVPYSNGVISKMKSVNWITSF